VFYVSSEWPGKNCLRKKIFACESQAKLRRLRDSTGANRNIFFTFFDLRPPKIFFN